MSDAPGRSPLSSARALALAELRATPVAVPWTRQAAHLAGALVAVALLAAAGAVVGGVAQPGDIGARAETITALLGLAVLGGVATVAPEAARARSWRALLLGAAPLVMVALAYGRDASRLSTTPPWVCSASHFGLGLVPLWLALRGVRQAAWSWPRALAAGIGAGTAGALLGELACARGALHVLAHHVGAWMAIVLVGVLISRQQKPRSFAP